MVYHSLIQVHKTIQQKKPFYLYERVTSQLSLLDTQQLLRSSYYYNTRQEARGVLRQVPEAAEARLDLADRSWCWRATNAYHSLPLSIKLETKLTKFKKQLKTWVLGIIET